MGSVPAHGESVSESIAPSKPMKGWDATVTITLGPLAVVSLGSPTVTSCAP